MPYLWISVAVTLQIIIYLNYLHYHLQYIKKGDDDELRIRAYFIHEVIGITMTFNVLEFITSDDGDNITDIAKYFKYNVKISPEIENPQPKLLEEVIGKVSASLIKHQVILKIIAGILKREPSEVPPLRIGSFFKNMAIGTMLRISPICNKFQLSIDVGLDDSAHTAIASGFAYGIIGNSIAFVTRFSNFYNTLPQINVTPKYNENILDVSLDCIFKVRLGHIIIASIRTLVNILTAYIRGGV